ncbi:hypothetical protein ACGYLV_10255 [Sulfitobacter sp. M21595]|uniref:hypothetical protein n=1 Tax=Sulfitobacter sp. M21595 TaxID=3368574 RepID=UPI003745F92A
MGLVEPHEVVARILFNPQHIKADGTVRSGLFSPKDIREKGVSLVRSERISPQELKAQAEAIAENYHKPRTAEGVIECKAEQIRDLVDEEGSRLFCLFDDPVVGQNGLPDNPAHATAIASNVLSDADIAQIKTLLTLSFGPLRRFA